MAFGTIVNTYRHEQAIASTSWNIAHNLGTTAPVVDVWLDIGGTITKALPLSVIVVDSSNLTITFSAAQAGDAFVV